MAVAESLIVRWVIRSCGRSRRLGDGRFVYPCYFRAGSFTAFLFFCRESFAFFAIEFLPVHAP